MLPKLFYHEFVNSCSSSIFKRGGFFKECFCLSDIVFVLIRCLLVTNMFQPLEKEAVLVNWL